GMTLPVWDQNKGKIQQARGNLARAIADLAVTRNTLVNNLADAFNRYQTARLQVAVGLRQIEDQVRVYRGAYRRRESDPAGVTFGALVRAEQPLATYIVGCVRALGAQWQAVVDVATLLQSDALSDEGGTPHQVPAVPGLPGCPPGPAVGVQLPAGPGPRPAPA